MSIAVLLSRTNPNPTYRMPLYPNVGGSRIAQQSGGKATQYIRCLDPIPKGRDYSGPYTEKDADPSSEEDAAPRMRHLREETERRTCTQPRGQQETVSQSIAERIRVHQAEIQKLKHDLEKGK